MPELGSTAPAGSWSHACQLFGSLIDLLVPRCCLVIVFHRAVALQTSSQSWFNCPASPRAPSIAMAFRPRRKLSRPEHFGKTAPAASSERNGRSAANARRRGKASPSSSRRSGSSSESEDPSSDSDAEHGLAADSSPVALNRPGPPHNIGHAGFLIDPCLEGISEPGEPPADAWITWISRPTQCGCTKKL